MSDLSLIGRGTKKGDLRYSTISMKEEYYKKIEEIAGVMQRQIQGSSVEIRITLSSVIRAAINLLHEQVMAEASVPVVSSADPAADEEDSEP